MLPELLMMTAQAPQEWEPCPTEDSVECVWNAHRAGNGEGMSFVVRATGERVYVSHRRAHQMIAQTEGQVVDS